MKPKPQPDRAGTPALRRCYRSQMRIYSLKLKIEERLRKLKARELEIEERLRKLKARG
jgi:hypothetical protein